MTLQNRFMGDYKLKHEVRIHYVSSYIITMNASHMIPQHNANTIKSTHFDYLCRPYIIKNVYVCIF